MSQLNSNFGESIPHLESLSVEDIINLLDTTNFSLTEKLDGSYMVIGWDHGGTYLSTKKGEKYYNFLAMPEVYYYKPFRDVAMNVLGVNLKHYISGCFGIAENTINSVKLIGELIPTHNHNIVGYDPQKIGKGVFVVFSLVVNDQIYSQESLVKLLRALNRTEKLLFFSAEEMEVNPQNFTECFKPVTDSLKEILLLEGHILNTPARTVSAKSIKNALKQKIVDLVVEAKLKFLSQYQTSKFGENVPPEGLVLHSKDHNITAKLVDKSKFTAIKEQNWFYIDIMKGFYSTLRQRAKEDPKNLPKHLDEYRKSLMSLKINKEQFTIQKRHEDTHKHFLMSIEYLTKIEIKLITSSVDEVSKAIVEHKL